MKTVSQLHSISVFCTYYDDGSGQINYTLAMNSVMR